MDVYCKKQINTIRKPCGNSKKFLLIDYRMHSYSIQSIMQQQVYP